MAHIQLNTNKRPKTEEIPQTTKFTVPKDLYPTQNAFPLDINQTFIEPIYPDPFRSQHRRVSYNESNIRSCDQTTTGTTGLNTPLESMLYADEQTMTFYDYHEPIFIRAGRIVASGPLSMASIMKKDPFLKVMLLRIRKEKLKLTTSLAGKAMDSKELVQNIVLDRENQNKNVEEKFQARLLENEGLDEIKLKTERCDTQVFGSDGETEAIRKIKEMIPCGRLMWLLVDRFFKSVLVVFMPFVNETYFRERLCDILGPRDDDPMKKPSVKIVRRMDFAFLGILFIILRLTSVCVTQKDSNTPDEKYILSNPIGTNIVNIAQICLNQFRLLRRGAIPVIQCSLMMRLYNRFAPEEGDGSISGDSEVFLGMLLQMANSIGMNRDLIHSTIVSRFERLVNVWRFIWHEIVTLDLEQGLMKGNPLLVNQASCDTQLPNLSEHRNIEDITLFESAVSNCETTDEINDLVRDILKDVLNLKERVRVNEFLVKVSKLEQYLDENFSSLEVLLKLPHTTISECSLKIHKFRQYVELKTALYTIYHHIFASIPLLNYPMILKMFQICMELVPLSYMLLTINNGKRNYFDEIFGQGAQLILVPSIFASLHKVSELLQAFVMRGLDVKYNYVTSLKHQPVEMILQKLLESYSLVRDGFASLSSVYYHAWRNGRSLDFIQEVLYDKDNIMDRGSKVNQESRGIPDDVNHYKCIPERNELYELSQWQLDQLSQVVTSKRFEEPVLALLNKKKVHTESVSDVSSTSRSPSQGFHVNPNVMSTEEVDMLWFQLMADGQPEIETFDKMDEWLSGSF
jgi:hypothetical protein